MALLPSSQRGMLTGEYLQLTLDKSSLSNGAWYSAIASSDLKNWSSEDNLNAFDVLVDSSSLLVLRDKTPVSPETPRFADIMIHGTK